MLLTDHMELEGWTSIRGGRKEATWGHLQIWVVPNLDNVCILVNI